MSNNNVLTYRSVIKWGMNVTILLPNLDVALTNETYDPDECFDDLDEGMRSDWMWRRWMWNIMTDQQKKEYLDRELEDYHNSC